MKFTILKDEIAKPITNSTGFISSKGLNPILEHILITTLNGKITIKSTNIQTVFIETIENPIEREGEVLIPAKDLNNIIREIDNSANIEFDYDGQRLNIKSGKFSSKLNTQSTENFPTKEDIIWEHNIPMDVEKFIKALKRTVFCISNDFNRVEYSGAHLTINENTVYVSSADYMRVATDSFNIDINQGEEITLNIPKKTVQELIKVFDAKEGTINIHTDGSWILFKHENIEIYSRLIDRYIKTIRSLFDKEPLIKIELNKDDLIAAIKRSSILISDTNNALLMKFNNKDINVSSLETEKGISRDELTAIKHDGDDIEIVVNSKYLLEILTNMQEEELLFKIITKHYPIIIEPISNEKYKYITVPLNIEKH